MDSASVKLTEREAEVLRLIAEGKSPREIADSLYISKRTVDFHLSRAYEKLQVRNRVQAVRRAFALGIAIL